MLDSSAGGVRGHARRSFAGAVLGALFETTLPGSARRDSAAGSRAQPRMRMRTKTHTALNPSRQVIFFPSS